MVHVKKKQGQSDDSLIKQFINMVRDSKIVEDAKRRKFYLKPSLARKLKRKEKQAETARIKFA